MSRNQPEYDILNAMPFHISHIHPHPLRPPLIPNRPQHKHPKQRTFTTKEKQTVLNQTTLELLLDREYENGSENR